MGRLIAPPSRARLGPRRGTVPRPAPSVDLHRVRRQPPGAACGRSGSGVREHVRHDAAAQRPRLDRARDGRRRPAQRGGPRRRGCCDVRRRPPGTARPHRGAPVLDRGQGPRGAHAADLRVRLDPEGGLPGAPVAGRVPVHPDVLLRRVRPLLRRGPGQRRGPVRRPRGGVPAGHRRGHAGGEGGRRPRRTGRPRPPVLRRHGSDPGRLRRGHHAHDGPAGRSTATVGRGHGGARPRARPASRHQLGPHRGGAHRVGDVGVGPRPARPGGSLGRARHRDQALSGAVPGRPAAVVPARRSAARLDAGGGDGVPDLVAVYLPAWALSSSFADSNGALVKVAPSAWSVLRSGRGCRRRSTRWRRTGRGATTRSCGSSRSTDARGRLGLVLVPPAAAPPRCRARQPTAGCRAVGAQHAVRARVRRRRWARSPCWCSARRAGRG